MALERYIEEHDPKSFGFACAKTYQQPSGEWVRCCKKTHKLLVIGANRISIPYCDEHIQEHA